MLQGPHLGGAAEVVGFGDAMGTSAKATLVAAVVDKGVMTAAEVLAKTCPRRAPPAVANGNIGTLPITDAPSPGSPFQTFVDGKTNRNDDDKTIDSTTTNTNGDKTIDLITANTSADNPVLRLDREVKSVLDKERTKTIELVDTIVGKAIEMLMIEQRTETNRQDEKLDDLGRIMIKRMEMLQDQITELLNQGKANKIEETMQQMTNKTATTTADRLIQKDKADGHPTALAQAVAEKTTNRADQYMVEHISMYTPEIEPDKVPMYTPRD